MKRFVLILSAPLLLYLASCTRDPKELARKYVETGNKYFEKGNYNAASIMYRRALQKNMRDGQAHYKLGLIQLQQRNLGEARRSFQRASDIDRNNTDALVKLGDVNLAIYSINPVDYRAYLADAKDAARKLLDKNPNSYDGLRLSGYIAFASKDLPGAIEKFKAANAIKPDQPEVALTLARVLYSNNQPDEAERIAKELIAKHKDFGPAYDLLYSRYLSNDRIADAESIIKAKAMNNPTVAQYWMHLAFHYSLSKRPDEMNAALAKLTSDPKTFPQGHMMVGDFLMRIGADDRAQREYQLGASVDPKNKALYEKREAEALTAQGKSSEAAGVISQLLKNNPKDAEAVAMHASMMLRSKDPKEAQKAIDELQPLLASTPQSEKNAQVLLHFNLGRAYMVKGDAKSVDKALEHFQTAVKINPNHIPAKLAMAGLMISRGEGNKALQAADEVIKLQPRYAPAHLVRTMSLVSIGETQRARQELTAMLQANPKLIDARFQLAGLDLAEKHFKDAESGYDALIKADDPRGIVGMVRCKTQEGDANAALELARNQVRQKPDNDDFRRLLVETDAATGRYEDAISDFQPLLQKNPNPMNYVFMGELQRALKQYDAAITSFKKAEQLVPNEPVPVLDLALLYDVAGRPDQARQEYERVLKLQPDNAAALNNLAYSMADQGVDLDKALAYAERARAKMPDNLDISDTIGLIYLRKNQVLESARLLSDLVNKAPNKATYHLHYAAALYQKGDKTGARKELEAAARTGPNDKEKLQIQELRQKLS